MSNRSLQALYYNVSVIGLSGIEDVRGCVGVGKSCLCNRFVRPDEDSYNSDHIYMLSQIDFGGEVVNNVPWLYWGETTKTMPENDQTCVFRVVEQTEFIDDTSFTLLSCGNHEPYHKRCLNLKLKSARKLVYICKDQLGVEDEYPKHYLVDGKICIDGFVFAFDVSNSGSVERQLECLRDVLMSMPKVQKRRPLVIATTKNDIAEDDIKYEFDRFLQRKEIRNLVNNVTIIETSAAKGVNVDSAFIALASLIEKSKTKPKILSYNDAASIKMEEVDRLKYQLHEKLLNSVISHRANWREWSHRLDHSLQAYFSVLGSHCVREIFEHHVTDLLNRFIDFQKRKYLAQLPKALDDLLSTNDILSDSTVSSIINQMKRHEHFDFWFVESPGRWDHPEFLERNDNRIPIGLLYTEEAQHIILLHSHKLEEADTINERRKEFLSLLRTKKPVKAGQKLSDVVVFLTGDECFDGLPESDRREVFSRYQDELTEKSKAEFQEILLERADLFFKLALPPSISMLYINGDNHTRSNILSNTSSPPLSANDCLMHDLSENMRHHPQYRNLDCLMPERNNMIFTHLTHFRTMASSPSALLPSVSPFSRPSSLCAAPDFVCPASPCVQSRLVEYLSRFASRVNPSTKTWPLYVIGQAPWSSGVAAALRERFTPFANCSFEFELHTPAIVIRPEIHVMESVSRRNLQFQPNSVILMVYRDAQSIALLEQIANQLARTQQYPCVVFHLCDASVLASEEVDVLTLRGGQLACQVKGVFAEMQLMPDTIFRQQPSSTDNTRASSSETLLLWHYLDNALNRALLAQPKTTIILAFMCSDLFPLELVMQSIINERTRFVPWKQRLYIGEEREIVCSSYFQLLQLLTGPLPAQVHGLILVFWTARKASLASMQAVCNHCPVHWPKLVVGVGVDGREEYLQGGQDLAHELEAPFAHIQPDQTDYKRQFNDFMRNCIASKDVTEDRNRQLMGAPARRPANHPSTLPPPPIPNATTQPVQRRKSSAGSSAHNSLIQNQNLASVRKSWHSSNSGHEDGLIYSVPDARGCSTGRIHRDVSIENQDIKKNTNRDYGEMSTNRSRHEEDEYSSPYDDLNDGSSLNIRSHSNELNSETIHPPLSQLDSNNLDMIYSEPLDIHAFGSSAREQVTPDVTSKEATTGGGSVLPLSVGESTRDQPFSDGENEYAEVEGYHPNQSQIHRIRIQPVVYTFMSNKKPSPPPPPPFPRTTSEADPWERRNQLRHTTPEYDEPACDSESPLTTPGDCQSGAVGGYLSLEEPEEFEKRRQRLSNISRHSSERRSHKESKKKSKGDLLSSKSFGVADRVEKKSRSGLAQGPMSNQNTTGQNLLGFSNTSRWRRAFRSGSSGNTASTTSPTRSDQKHQDNSPKIQAPPPPVDPFVVTCTDYVDRHGIRLQGIYRESGNKNVAEAIRQRSNKDSHFLDWLSTADLTAHDVATAMKLHLRDLSEPIMPIDLGTLREILALPTTELRIDRLRMVVFSLPPPNQRLLYHILRHLYKVTEYCSVNDMTASNLATCWTPTLVFPHKMDVVFMMAVKSIQEIVTILIEHFYAIFPGNP